MAPKTVRLIVGQILTDEELRAKFLERPLETLASLHDMDSTSPPPRWMRSRERIAGCGDRGRSGSTRGFNAAG
jgi:hypothetical protein